MFVERANTSENSSEVVSKAQEVVVLDNSAQKKKVPEGLRGLSIDAILLLEVDGGLNEEEQQWLNARKSRFERMTYPSPYGWMD